MRARLWLIILYSLCYYRGLMSDLQLQPSAARSGLFFSFYGSCSNRISRNDMYYVSHNASRLPLSIHNINIIIYIIYTSRIVYYDSCSMYVYILYICLCAPLVFGRHFFTTSLNFKCLSQYNNNVCGCVRGDIREATVYAVVGQVGTALFILTRPLLPVRTLWTVKTSATQIVFSRTRATWLFESTPAVS